MFRIHFSDTCLVTLYVECQIRSQERCQYVNGHAQIAVLLIKKDLKLKSLATPC